MRRLSICFVLFSMFAAPAFAETRYRISVPDMECAECAGPLVHNLEQEPGVARARADIAAQTLRVTLKHRAYVPQSRLESIVRASGFTPAEIRAE